jgi:predicted metal-binding protein
MCNENTSEVAQMGNINIHGEISGSVFVCQDCREKLIETKNQAEADFYDYSADLWLQWE